MPPAMLAKPLATSMSARSLAMSKLSNATTSTLEAPSPTDSDASSVKHRPAMHDQNNLPRLKREWSFWSLFAFSTLTLGTWEGAASLLAQIFLNGGPAALLYGGIGLAIGTSCVYASLAELASLQPMIGAQYVWTAQFAPRKFRRFATFIQGWLTTIAWQLLVPALAYLAASQARGIIILLSPAHAPQHWHVCLIMVGFLLFSCMSAILWKRWLPMMAILAAVLHFLFFIGIIATALAKEHYADSSFVWQNDHSIYSGDTPAVSFCIGFVTLAFTFAGGESTVHLAEESHRPEITVPRAMMASFVVGTITAFAISVVLLYGITDVMAILTTSTGSPIVEILRQATGSDGAAATLTLFIPLMGLPGTTLAMISASRLTWAFARDGGFIGKALYLDRISPTFGVPMYAVLANTTVAILLSLIVLGSEIVFQGVISFAPLTLYTSYFITIALFLYHRLVNKGLVYGPWNLGRFGVPVNIIAICLCMFLIIFLPFPLVRPVSWENLNYAGPVLALILVVTTAIWFLGAARHFRGPIIQMRIAGQGGQEDFTVFSRAEWLSDDLAPL